jgi:hypothetical protein
VKECSWEFVVFCNVEDDLPFTVLFFVVVGEVEHPLNTVSVCCKFVFSWVVGEVVDGGVSGCGFTKNINF